MTMISFELNGSHGVHCAPCVYINYKWIQIFYHIICSSVTIQIECNELPALLFLYFAFCFIFSPFNSYFLHRIPIIIIYFVIFGLTVKQEILMFHATFLIADSQQIQRVCYAYTMYGCCFVSHTDSNLANGQCNNNWKKNLQQQAICFQYIFLV